MQLRKMTLMLAALGAMSMVLTGCPDGGRESLTCTADTDCIEGEICHPGAKVCVQTCTSGADCPESSKTCEVISSTNSTKVCQCSTDALCQRDERISDASGLKCSTTHKVCTDGDTTPTPTTCSGEGQSTCAYGQFCSGTTCTAVPAPTCANFDPAQGGRAPTFNAATSTGPIIYDVTQVSFAQDSFCGDGTAGSTGLTAKARVKAYIKTGTFPAEKSGLPGLFYVRVNGTQVDGTTLIRPSEYTTAEAGKRAEFTMNFCPGSTATTLSIGLYFTGGNEICKQLNR
ncbi:hypothetical protein ATI61_108200 [Archangium gephyra]|uniref:CHP n=1 Tax=Archangium gephyra TaxID=48 RepID=A0AAC8TE23_9BACT|nr:hypothetical protein [Archangium gephyra]AKJ02413.1 CHP [Archangium gephyra]REG28662.1 hypothetical protein ATI61_108200 [Archangium gephyra]